MALLGREDILQADDILTEDVAVPEWGGTVRVRGLTGAERDGFEADSVRGKGKNTSVNLANLRARLVALAVVDEHGNRLFGPADVAALGRKSAAALTRVYEVATRLSGLGESDVAELTEDFDAAQNGSSTTD